MSFLAGQTITAAQLNRIQPTSYTVDGTALASPTLAVAEADIPSASVTISTSAANATFKAWAVFDISVTSTGATVQGRLNVDGSTVAGSAILTAPTNNSRASVSYVWYGTLASSGSHTFKLRGIRDFASGTQSIVNSRLIVEITEVV